MALINNPTNGAVATHDGNQYIFDAANNRWMLLKSENEIALENTIQNLQTQLNNQSYDFGTF